LARGEWLLNTPFIPSNPDFRPPRGFWDVIMHDAPKSQPVYGSLSPLPCPALRIQRSRKQRRRDLNVRRARERPANLRQLLLGPRNVSSEQEQNHSVSSSPSTTRPARRPASLQARRGVTAYDLANPHVCPWAGCGKRFKQKKGKLTHVRAIHEEKYKCQRCGMLLGNGCSLRRHAVRKTGCLPLAWTVQRRNEAGFG
jgi:hypothetical protein